MRQGNLFQHALNDEARAAISARFKGKKLSAEHVNKRSEAQRGRKRSPETRAKIAAAARRRVEEGTHNFLSHSGKKNSSETCDKISRALRGKKREPFDAEWRANMSRAQRLRRQREDHV